MYGQIAYEAYYKSRTNGSIPFVAWDQVDVEVREAWDAVGEAVAFARDRMIEQGQHPGLTCRPPVW